MRFVDTFKRDCVARMGVRDARTMLAQLPAAFEHFSEVYPPALPKIHSPRERPHQASRERLKTR